MTQSPLNLSPEWPPTTDQLATAVRDMHWRLEQLAYDLETRPHVTRGGQIPAVAKELEALAYLLQLHDKAWLDSYRSVLPPQRSDGTEGAPPQWSPQT
jgi:hypothetical protein